MICGLLAFQRDANGVFVLVDGWRLWKLSRAGKLARMGFLSKSTALSLRFDVILMYLSRVQLEATDQSALKKINMDDLKGFAA
jgi:hypothetical protein